MAEETFGVRNVHETILSDDTSRHVYYVEHLVLRKFCFLMRYARANCGNVILGEKDNEFFIFMNTVCTKIKTKISSFRPIPIS